MPRARTARRRGGTPTKAAQSRADRRAEVARRRGAAILIGSAVAAAVILVAWFPAGALLSQRRTLAETTATLHELRTQDQALRVESKNLATPAEIARIARQQFGLIAPGQLAYQVLPPPGRAGANDPDAGDPGLAPLVSPSAAPELPPGTVTGSGSEHTVHQGGTGHPSASPGLLSRVLHTLEFWR